MTPALLVTGSLMVFWAAVCVAIFLPAATVSPTPSDAWRPWSEKEAAGHRLYVANGCSYCHSQFVRTFDWDLGAVRIAKEGDYHQMNPAILGTERTGPDLSQQGGEHPDDWHRAHFTNPRFTRPWSLMPSWGFLGTRAIEELTAYMQSLGSRDADLRVSRQETWRRSAWAAFNSGPDRNIEWLHAHVPPVWRPMPNPYPATAADLERGRKLFQGYCINCHGPMGDGGGPAGRTFRDSPPPLNFTTLRRHLVENRYIGGILYYQIMNGITGTAMPYFKRELESEKIWDLSNYVAAQFLGYTDAGIEPRGIPAAYEPAWTNTYAPPSTTKGGAP
jgi:cbb3-type cytochrome c oxidase subunit II